jgi:glutamyl-tRNA reductase
LLERTGVIGVSWRGLASGVLAGYSIPDAELPRRLRDFADENHLSELVYLGTCNRIELWYVSADSAPVTDLRADGYRLLTGRTPGPGEAERTIKCWQGEGAAEHLFLVASGLDSACLGENEIVAQLRRAFERSAGLDLLGPTLASMGELAMQVSAKVRTETGICRGHVSLAEVAVGCLKDVTALASAGGGLAPVALIGVSPMNERIAKSLRGRGVPLLVVNRTVERARSFANDHGGDYMSLQDFVHDPPAVTALVSAVAAPGPVIRADCLSKILARNGPGMGLVIVDFGVPANVDAGGLTTGRGLARYGMDEIVAAGQRSQDVRASQAAAARILIDAALDGLRESVSERLYGPVLGALQGRYQLTAREGLDRLFRKELSGLGEQERAAIERWCHAIARRFAHIPSLGLRGLIRKGPPGSVDAFIDALDAPFSGELRSVLSRASRSSESIK